MNLADRRLLLLDRKKEILKSRASLIPFARYMSPDPDNRVDALCSSYEVARHHRVIGAALEEVEAGRIKRLMISCPPRHGKTKLASMLFPAWAVGRNPRKSIVFATYNDKFAQDIGGVVKTTMQSPLYNHVFPKLELRYGGAANDRLRIADGGDLFFVGVGGTLTGRGGDINILDDPVKNRKEADSPIVRESALELVQQRPALPHDDPGCGAGDHRHALERRRHHRPPHRPDQPLLQRGRGGDLVDHQPAGARRRG